MKNLSLFLLALAFYGCVQGQDHSIAKLPEPKPNEKLATFAGGCFWAMTEAMRELKGVDQVIAGYAGGTVKNPTYEQVCEKNTGHAETVQIYYDPKVISYDLLVHAFLFAHNPTELDYQGPDTGDDYRSEIWYRTPQERAIVLDEIKKVNALHHYNAAIVTKVEPYKTFYAAEVYHQGYYRLHPESGYIQGVSVPKIMKMRQAVPELLKPEFRK